MKSLMNTGYVKLSFAGITSGEGNCHSPRLKALPLGLALLIFSWLAAPKTAAAIYSNATSLISARGNHTATLLPDGRLLIAGGQTNGGFTLSSAEVYNPATSVWSMIGSMNDSRA